jgi:tetratricopeptide (TPR) repeat protein
VDYVWESKSFPALDRRSVLKKEISMINNKLLIVLLTILAVAVLLLPGCNQPTNNLIQPSTSAHPAEDHVYQGIQLRGDGRDDEAIAEFTAAIEINPKYSEAYLRRANVYSWNKQYDLAIADYSKAIEFDPNYVLAYENRGGAYYAMEQYDLALADYSKVVELNPDCDAYTHRGIGYSVTKQYDLAINDFSMALTLNPVDEGFVYFCRAQAYRDMGLSAQAIADYKKDIELSKYPESKQYDANEIEKLEQSQSVVIPKN